MEPFVLLLWTKTTKTSPYIAAPLGLLQENSSQRQQRSEPFDSFTISDSGRDEEQHDRLNGVQREWRACAIRNQGRLLYYKEEERGRGQPLFM